jgi:hypothetical protein
MHWHGTAMPMAAPDTDGSAPLRDSSLAKIGKIGLACTTCHRGQMGVKFNG